MIDFETFYKQYQNQVHIRICTLLHYRPDLIDDAIQDAWLKIWRGLPNLRHEGNVASWVYLVTTNCVRDIMRKQKMLDFHYRSLDGFLEKSALDEDELNMDALQEADPHSYIPETLDRQDIRRVAWGKMNAKDKAAIRSYVNNKPVGEAIHVARRNFKDKLHRLEQKRERMSA